jgi:uncharacterized glyoxalase superfamily protein PhnB
MATYDPVITPTVFYADPIAAMRWLEKALGFETVLLVQGSDGGVGYSEMAFNGGVISVAGEWAGDQLGGAKMHSPKNLDGAGTQFLWVKVPDVDAHCAAARGAGAQIAQEPEDQFYGARTYRVRDPEGHIWCFTQAVRDIPVEEQEKASGLKFKNKLD